MNWYNIILVVFAFGAFIPLAISGHHREQERIHEMIVVLLRKNDFEAMCLWILKEKLADLNVVMSDKQLYELLGKMCAEGIVIFRDGQEMIDCRERTVRWYKLASPLTATPVTTNKQA